MTETTATDRIDQEASVERYFRFWNAETPEEQHRLAAETFTSDVEYHAPIGVLVGSQALIDFRNEFVAHMGSAALQRRGEVQAHHDRARLAWEIQVEGRDESFAAGTDVLEFAADGRINSISSFLDRAPEGFDPHAHE